MSVLIPADDGSMLWWCVGCDEYHMFKTPGWTWNGSSDKPTVAPSILVRSGHYGTGRAGEDCWCTYEKRLGKPAPYKCTVCHVYITDGKIQYLPDCTHAYAGKTVAMTETNRT